MNFDFFITGIDHILFVSSDTSVPVIRYPDEVRSNELIFHFNSDATVYFNDTVMRTHDNSIRFLPKGKNERYEVFSHNLNARNSCVDIFFQTDRPVTDKAYVDNSPDNGRLAPLFKHIFSTWVSRRDGYYFECISLLYKIFAEMQKSSYLPPNKLRLIEPAVSYINRHFTEENISSEQLASLCGISYSYVKKLFVQQFGLSPKQYALQMKIRRAEDLLASGRYSVADTAAMCGYVDMAFFSRQFKIHTGLSPKDYSTKAKAGL